MNTPLSITQQEQDEKFDKYWGDTLTEQAVAGILKFLRNRDLAIENAVRAEVLEKLDVWVEHTNRCILSQGSAGRPTEDGGYENKYAGKWYSSRPINNTPKCNCGLNETLALLTTSPSR